MVSRVHVYYDQNIIKKNIMIKTNIEAKCFRKYLFSCIHSHQYSEEMLQQASLSIRVIHCVELWIST